jgi:hypothetical protein
MLLVFRDRLGAGVVGDADGLGTGTGGVDEDGRVEVDAVRAGFGAGAGGSAWQPATDRVSSNAASAAPAPTQGRLTG